MLSSKATPKDFIPDYEGYVNNNLIGMQGVPSLDPYVKELDLAERLKRRCKAMAGIMPKG